MKKTLLSLLMLSTVGIYTSQAQITVNSGDVVNITDQVETATDTLPGAITIGSSGSTSWNFSTLNQHTLDTSNFVSPAGLPGATDFPLSNMAMINSDEDSSWIYLTKSNFGLFIDGFHQIQGGQANSIPFATTIITFPSTYLTNYGGSGSADLGSFQLGVDPDSLLVPPFTNGPHGIVDSLKITRTSVLTSNIDAYGAVTTPFGLFQSLRQVVEVQDIDTTWQLVNGNWEIISFTTVDFLANLPPPFGPFFIDSIAYDTTFTARWWTDDPTARFPIVEMDYEANGTVNTVEWQKSTPTTGVNEAVTSIDEVTLYPNPAANEITINVSTALNNNSVEILDVTGKLIATSSFRSNKITLSVSDYSNGIYFYNITDVNGKVIHSDKFVVAK